MTLYLCGSRLLNRATAVEKREGQSWEGGQ